MSKILLFGNELNEYLLNMARKGEMLGYLRFSHILFVVCKYFELLTSKILLFGNGLNEYFLNIARKGAMLGYQHFLLFLQCF